MYPIWRSRPSGARQSRAVSSILPPTPSRTQSRPSGAILRSSSRTSCVVRWLTTWSHPRSFRSRALSSDPQVPITVHPASFANWTAKCPAPPAAAVIRTVSPGRIFPVPSSMAHEVRAEIRSPTHSGEAVGTFQTVEALATSYSEKALPTKHTASPIATRSTSLPTAATIPTPSAPRRKDDRPLFPTKACSPRARKVSQPPLIPAYRTRIKTSSSPSSVGVGVSSSVTLATSRKPEPAPVPTRARKVFGTAPTTALLLLLVVAVLPLLAVLLLPVTV
mmetsp:Transcript_15048/g.34892  ORF Transcript_15048/g.34892 Transcript_15048/m.34892 type:complete len:277 (+) Transcript_15048:664-1494(+)